MQGAAVTPAVEQPIADIRHAYLRYMVDPLGARFADDLQKKARLGAYALDSPILQQRGRVHFAGGRHTAGRRDSHCWRNLN